MFALPMILIVCVSFVVLVAIEIGATRVGGYVVREDKNMRNEEKALFWFCVVWMLCGAVISFFFVNMMLHLV